MKKTFTEKRFYEWHEDEICVSLRANGATCGGGGETLIVDTLVFDAAQITSPENGFHPQWGGYAPHSTGTPDA